MRALIVICCLPLLAGAAVARAQSPSAATAQAQMWDVVDAPGWSIMVRSVERLRDPLPNPNGVQPVRPTGQFAVLVFDLTNQSSQTQTPPAADFLLSSANGGRWPDLAASPAAQTYAQAQDLIPFGAAVPPGATIRTIALFDIDFHATRLTLNWRPAGEHTIRIDECHCNLPIPSQIGTSG